MSEKSEYRQDQEKETPLRFHDLPFAGIRHVFWRSYAEIMAGKPGQDYLAWRADGRQLAFCVIEGVGSSLAGQPATKPFGDLLVNWLFSNDCFSKTEEQLLEMLQNQVKEFITGACSQAAFLCGKVETRPQMEARVFLVGCGDLAGYVLDRQGKPLYTNLAGDYAGAAAQVSGPLERDVRAWVSPQGAEVSRLVLNTDGLGFLHKKVLEYDDRDLQEAVAASVLEPRSDDISFLDIFIKPAGMQQSGVELACQHKAGGRVWLTWAGNRPGLSYLVELDCLPDFSSRWKLGVPADASGLALPQTLPDGLRYPLYARVKRYIPGQDTAQWSKIKQVILPADKKTGKWAPECYLRADTQALYLTWNPVHGVQYYQVEEGQRVVYLGKNRGYRKEKASPGFRFHVRAVRVDPQTGDLSELISDEIAPRKVRPSELEEILRQKTETISENPAGPETLLRGSAPEKSSLFREVPKKEEVFFDGDLEGLPHTPVFRDAAAAVAAAAAAGASAETGADQQPEPPLPEPASFNVKLIAERLETWWPEVSGAAGYELWASLASFNEASPPAYRLYLGENAGCTLPDKQIFEPGFYYFRARAIDAASRPGAWSLEQELPLNLEILPTVLPLPHSLEINLKWQKVENISHYEVQLDGERTFQAGSEEISLEGIDPGQHILKIRPVFTGRLIPWEEIAPSEVTVGPPVSLRAEDVSILEEKGAYILRWYFSRSSEVDTFEIVDPLHGNQVLDSQDYKARVNSILDAVGLKTGRSTYLWQVPRSLLSDGQQFAVQVVKNGVRGPLSQSAQVHLQGPPGLRTFTSECTVDQIDSLLRNFLRRNTRGELAEQRIDVLEGPLVRQSSVSHQNRLLAYPYELRLNYHLQLIFKNGEQWAIDMTYDVRNYNYKIKFREVGEES